MADERTYGALNGSGNALKVKPKLSSIVSAFLIWPLVKNGVVSSCAPAAPAR